MKYVSDSNLSRFFTKLKGIFAKKSEVPSQADVDAKLSLSGGTMTGAIKLGTGGEVQTNSGKSVIQLNEGVSVLFGNTSEQVVIRTNNSTIKHNMNGQVKEVLDTGNTAANPTLAGTEAALEAIKINGTSYKNQPASVSYLTTAPSSANTDGLKIVVLSSESGVTKQSGYLYIFTGA